MTAALPPEPPDFDDVWEEAESGLVLRRDPTITEPYTGPSKSFDEDACDRIFRELEFKPTAKQAPASREYDRESPLKNSDRINIPIYRQIGGHSGPVSTLKKIQESYKDWAQRPDLDGLDPHWVG